MSFLNKADTGTSKKPANFSNCSLLSVSSCLPLKNVHIVDRATPKRKANAVLDVFVISNLFLFYQLNRLLTVP